MAYTILKYGGKMQILKSATYSVHTHTQAQEIAPLQTSPIVSNTSWHI